MLIEKSLTNTSTHLGKVYWKKSLKRLFYAFDKSLVRVSSDFIKNIDKSVLEVSSDFIDDDYKKNL